MDEIKKKRAGLLVEEYVEVEDERDPLQDEVCGCGVTSAYACKVSNCEEPV